MSGGVNDVNFVIIPIYRRLLRGNSDAAFVLLVATVHNKRLRHFGLIRPKGVALFQETINQRRFSVVDVSDNSNVANVFWIFHKIKPFPRASNH